MKRTTATLALLLTISFAAGAARAADWPMWGGAIGHNMVNANETGIASEWTIPDEGLEGASNIKWRASLGSQSYGNPVIHEGRLFLGTNNGAERNPEITGDKGIIMAFDEATGELLWQLVHDKLPSGRVNDWPEQGVCSTVAAEGDRIWYVSNQCQIVCADVEGFRDGENDGPYTDEKYTGEMNGDIIWIVDMMEDYGVFPHNLATSSPLIVGDRLFVITSNGVDEGHFFIPSPRAPSFLCVDKNTGELVWESRLPGKNILHGQWSSPTYGEVNGKGQVYFPGGDGWLYALDPATGDLIWKFNMNAADAIWELGGRGTKNNIIGTPVFVDGVVYLGVGQDPEHGIGAGNFFAINADGSGDITDTGTIWNFKGVEGHNFTRTMSTAAVVDERIYISDLNGFLWCLDRADGGMLWKYDTLAAIWGSATVIDGKVYLGDEDGDVVVLEDSDELIKLAENTINNSSYTTPVAANGTLYIANRSELYAIALPSGAGGGQ